MFDWEVNVCLINLDLEISLLKDPITDCIYDYVVETEIDMPENILGTKFTGLVFIILLMATAMRDHGTKVVSKAMECIRSAMEIEDVVNGMVAPSRHLCPHKQSQSLEQFRYFIRRINSLIISSYLCFKQLFLCSISYHISWLLICRVLEKLLKILFT